MNQYSSQAEPSSGGSGPGGSEALPGGDPRALLAMIDADQERLLVELRPDPRVIFGGWGIAWLLGFSALYLGEPSVGVLPWPFWVSGAIFAVLIFGMTAVSAVYSAKASRGIRGKSSWQGALYGSAWGYGFVFLWLLGMALLRSGMPPELMNIYMSSGSCLIIGMMYIFGSALWRDRAQLFLALWLFVIGAGSGFFGTPANYLVLALSGGIVFLLAAAYFALRHRRAAAGGRAR
jgi:hypothetical protein